MAKKDFGIFQFLTLASLFLYVAICGCSEKRPEALTTVRIGWMGGRFPQSQIVETLKRTGICDYYRLSFEFVSFRSAEELLSDAETGRLDVVLATSSTAARLIDRNSRWTIQARFARNRVSLYPTPEIEVKTLADLEDRTFAVPFNSEEHRVLLKAIRDAGLEAEDFRFRDYATESQLAALQEGEESRTWKRVSGLVNSDHRLMEYEVYGQVRSLRIGDIVSVLMVSESFAEPHAEILAEVLAAFMEAHFYLAQHFDQTVDWINEIAERPYESKFLWFSASEEANVRALMKGQVSLHLSRLDLENIQSQADYLLECDLIEDEVNIRAFGETRYLRRAEELWWGIRDFTPSVRAH